MEATQRWRGRLFAPLLHLLTACRVTPTHLTLLSLLVGAGFAPLWAHSAIAALVCLLGHVLLDGLDGPLARHQGVASRQGSFTDSMADQVVVTLVLLTLMHAEVVTVVAGGLFLILYWVVLGFAMIRNALAIPYSWLVRPRFFVFAWIAIDHYLWPGSLDTLLWICNVLLAIKSLTGFTHIREKL